MFALENTKIIVLNINISPRCLMSFGEQNQEETIDISC